MKFINIREACSDFSKHYIRFNIGYKVSKVPHHSYYPFSSDTDLMMDQSSGSHCYHM
jgi:hypothetical protein